MMHLCITQCTYWTPLNLYLKTCSGLHVCSVFAKLDIPGRLICSWYPLVFYLQGNDPECNSNIQPDGVIGQNIFNIPPDEVQLSCSVIYYGKMLPQLEWRKVGDDSSVLNGLTSVVTSINLITSILTLKGDISLDKSSYVCQTTMSTQNQYNCTSEIVKVLCKYIVNQSIFLYSRPRLNYNV